MYKHIAILAFMTISFSCTSDSGPDLDIPEFPIQRSDIDFSYFQSFVQGTNYNQAQNLLASDIFLLEDIESLWLIAYNSNLNSFFVNETPDLENGILVWRRESQTRFGTPLFLTLSAEPTLDNVEWIYYNEDEAFREANDTFETYFICRMTNGAIRGKCDYYITDAEGDVGNRVNFVFLEKDFNYINENDFTIDYLFNILRDPETGESNRLDVEYEKSGDQFTMTVTDLDAYSDLFNVVTFEWDVSTGFGSFDVDGQRRCWDNFRQDIACS